MSIKIEIIDRNDQTHIVEANESDTIASVIKQNIAPDNFMVCGGCCACATCHVKIDDEYLSLLQPMDEDEDALLDSEDRSKNSRLGCQVWITPEMAGMKLRIAK